MDDVLLIKTLIRKIDSMQSSGDDGEVQNIEGFYDSVSIMYPSFNDPLTLLIHKYNLICGNFVCGGDKII